MNTTHVEHDALAALRAELTMAAGRRIRRHRARRRTAVIVAVIALLLAATAATAGLTNFTTGVPVVDELVGHAPPPPPHGQHRLADNRPGPGPGTEPLDVPMGDGVYKAVAYLSRDGGICVAVAERHRGGVRGGMGGCPPLDWVNRRVERRGATWAGSSIGLDERTYQALVAGGVQKVEPLAEGDWRVLVSPSWRPRAPAGRPLRLVVLIDDRDYGNPADGFQREEQDDIPRDAWRPPKMRLTFRDGHHRVARGP